MMSLSMDTVTEGRPVDQHRRTWPLSGLVSLAPMRNRFLQLGIIFLVCVKSSLWHWTLVRLSQLEVTKKCYLFFSFLFVKCVKLKRNMFRRAGCLTSEQKRDKNIFLNILFLVYFIHDGKRKKIPLCQCQNKSKEKFLLQVFWLLTSQLIQK